MDDMYLFKSQDEGNRLLYAYYKGEFWFYDPNVQQWYISGHVREQYELEAQKDISLTPDDFTCTGYGYEFVAEYEVPVAVLDALRAAKKVLPPEPASAEPPEIVDEGSGPEDGFPGWVRPMVEAFLQFPFFRELPAFTAFAIRHSEPVQHHPGGTLADGLYDTDSKGVKFSVFRGKSSDHYREVRYTWAGFVRHCRAAGLEPEPLRQDKEATPCNTEPTAPTGAAAATTDASAAVSMAETSTTSESGEDADSCETPAPDAQPNKEPPAGLAPTAPMSLPAFDYTGLSADTAEHLQKLARRAMQAKQRYILNMMEIVAEAHRELVALCDKRNNQYSESTFRAWCASIGVGKDTAYRLLQVQALMDGSTPEEQEALAEAPAALLYAAAKPSAPAELVQAVKDGDITTHKQYQEALAEIRARDAKIKDLLEMSEAADRRAEEEERKRKEANEGYAAAMETLRQAQEDAADSDARARAAENRAAGAQKLADQRGAENTELKAKLRELESRPVEVAVAQPDEDQIEAWRKEGEARILATARDLAGKARQAQQQAECHASDLEDENNRLRDALNRTNQLDQSAAMACGACSAALGAWFESTARDVPADLGPALARMRRLHLALDIAIENGVWPDDDALDDLGGEAL